MAKIINTSPYKAAGDTLRFVFIDTTTLLQQGVGVLTVVAKFHSPQPVGL